MKAQQSNATNSRKIIHRIKANLYAGEEIRHMIAEAAYFHAEHRGFQGDNMDNDWFIAEAEIEELLSKEQPH